MRPYWKGHLKLALVSCPIALHAACSSAERIAFRQINKATGNRLRQQLIDEETREPVGPELRRRLGASLRLMLPGAVLGCVLGVLLGVLHLSRWMTGIYRANQLAHRDLRIVVEQMQRRVVAGVELHDAARADPAHRAPPGRLRRESALFDSPGRRRAPTRRPDGVLDRSKSR